jgi:hypothetical protein
MKPTLIHFPLDMLSRLRSIATQRQVSLACIVRSIIEQYFRTIDSNPKA